MAVRASVFLIFMVAGVSSRISLVVLAFYSIGHPLIIFDGSFIIKRWFVEATDGEIHGH